MNQELCYLIDSNLNLYIIKEKAVAECINSKHIAPLDIVSQVANENIEELIQELKYNLGDDK